MERLTPSLGVLYRLLICFIDWLPILSALVQLQQHYQEKQAIFNNQSINTILLLLIVHCSTYNLVRLYMDLSNDSKKYLQTRDNGISKYFVLGCLVLICCLNYYEYSQLNNRPQLLRQNLEKWVVGMVVNDSMRFYQGKIDQSEALLKEFKQLIQFQRLLYTKFKAVNKDIDQVEDLVDYQNKLGSFEQIQAQFFAENSEISLKNKVIGLKGKAISSKGQQFNNFQKQIMDSITQVNNLNDQLLSTIILNCDWKDKIQKTYEQNEKNSKHIQLLQLSLYDYQAYYTLPELAKEVLDHDNIIKLAKLLYTPDKYSKLPNELDLRQKKVKQRASLANQKAKLQSFSLIRYNLQSAADPHKWQNDILNNYQQMNKKYNLDSIQQQKKMCILVPTFNNNKHFRVQANLNSIFSQNYTNYKVVIIDDASGDNTAQRISIYLKFYKINKQKCLLIKNKQNKKALQNLYTAGLNNCQDSEVITIVDGDDELIGFNTLKVINSVYTRQKLGVVYSSFYYYNPINYYVTAGFTAQYLPEQKKDLRKAQQKFSHLITFKSQLLSAINPQDLKQDNGLFYQVAYDFAMMYPMMQLACGRVKKINQFQYLYSIGTGANDYQLFEKKQKQIGISILNKEKYSCLDHYKQS